MEVGSSRPIASAPARDLRIDLLKGVALAMILVDHVDDLAGVCGLSRWTLRAMGPSDAAELFLLLSGLVVGRTSAARIDRHGWWSAQRRVLWRALSIYVGLILAAAAMLGLQQLTDATPQRFLRWSGSTAETGTARPIGLLTLQQMPYVLQILAVYIVLLPFAPLMVSLLRRGLAWGLLPAAGLYGWVQFTAWHPESAVALPTPGWYFNVWAWQFLFMLGLAGGVAWSRLPGAADAANAAPRATSGRWLGGLLCAAVVIAGWWVRPDVTSGAAPLIEERWSRRMLTLLVDKPIAGPVRLMHALAVAGLAALVLPRAWRQSLPPGLRPVAECGRYSLAGYLAGVLLTCGAGIAMQVVGNDPGTVALLEINALTWLAIAAALWSRCRSRRERSVGDRRA